MKGGAGSNGLNSGIRSGSSSSLENELLGRVGKRFGVARFRESTLWTGALVHFGIVEERAVGFADLEVCLAKLKSVEQRLKQWIQLKMT